MSAVGKDVGVGGTSGGGSVQLVTTTRKAIINKLARDTQPKRVFLYCRIVTIDVKKPNVLEWFNRQD
jgi:hypothetical protein